MAKNKLGAIIIAIQTIAFSLTLVSGLVIDRVLSGGRGAFFLGISHYQWTKVHSSSGLLFFLLVIFHLIFHRESLKIWLKTLKGKEKD